MDLSNTSVRREWAHTDILCVNEDEDNRLVVLIENKIDSCEGVASLRKYLQEVKRAYPPSRGFKTIPLYLTPEGDAPTDEESPIHSCGLHLGLQNPGRPSQYAKVVIGADVFMSITTTPKCCGGTS